MKQVRAYRRDIDGLRAIAVLPVVVFHIAQSYLRGGYVGVDIFFVISGYLISSHIMADAAAGRFDLLDFYRRRIRRILPAFVALLTVVTALVVWRFFPVETIKYAGSLLAALGSVSNLYFWRDAGYFQPTVKSLPLLHTWSLAVEEQFYLVFPLIIMGVTRWASRRLTLIVTGLLGLSLALSAAYVTAFPSGDFYLLPTRAWELLIGTVLALGVIPAIRNPFVRNLVAATGLALIAGSMMLFTPTTPFPGIAALAPCLGAALIIHSGQAGTWVSSLLSLRPLVFIGLISYSLYLWHWPIMVFQRYDALLLVTDSKVLARASVLALSLIAAALSWWLIERPTRDRSRIPDRPLFLGLGAAVAGLVVLALVLIGTQGLPGRFPAGAVRMAAYLERAPNADGNPCFFRDSRSFSTFDRSACLPDRPNRPTYLVVGDSHAAALSPSLREVFPEANVLQITAADCLPVLEQDHRSVTAACEDAMRFALRALPRQRHIDAIWLIGRFSQENAVSRRVDRVTATADALARDGIRVVVIGPGPEYTAPLPRILARAAIAGDASSLERQLSGQPFEADRLFQIAARQHGFGYVSLIDALCSSRRCQAVAGDGAPMLFDGDHATPAGARVIAGRISDGLVAQSGVAPPPTGSPKPRSEPAPLSRINGPGPAG